MRNSGREEAQAGIKVAGRNINNLRYADDTTLMAESEEELQSLLMKVLLVVASRCRAWALGNECRLRWLQLPGFRAQA